MALRLAEVKAADASQTLSVGFAHPSMWRLLQLTGQKESTRSVKRQEDTVVCTGTPRRTWLSAAANKVPSSNSSAASHTFIVATIAGHFDLPPLLIGPQSWTPVRLITAAHSTELWGSTVSFSFALPLFSRSHVPNTLVKMYLKGFCVLLNP